MEYISCIYLFLCPRTHIRTSNLSHLSVDMRAYSYAEAFMDWETIYRHVQPSMVGRGAYLLVFQLFSLRLGLNTCEPYGGPCIVPSSACIWLTLVLQSHGSTLSVTVFCEKYKKWKNKGKWCYKYYLETIFFVVSDAAPCSRESPSIIRESCLRDFSNNIMKSHVQSINTASPFPTSVFIVNCIHTKGKYLNVNRCSVQNFYYCSCPKHRRNNSVPQVSASCWIT